MKFSSMMGSELKIWGIVIFPNMAENELRTIANSQILQSDREGVEKYKETTHNFFNQQRVF